MLDIVKKLILIKIKFTEIINVSRMEGEVTKWFAKYGIWIRILMDGCGDESYSKYQVVPKGGFSRVINNIKEFKKVGGKCFLGISLNAD